MDPGIRQDDCCHSRAEMTTFVSTTSRTPVYSPICVYFRVDFIGAHLRQRVCIKTRVRRAQALGSIAAALPGSEKVDEVFHLRLPLGRKPPDPLEQEIVSACVHNRCVPRNTNSSE